MASLLLLVDAERMGLRSIASVGVRARLTVLRATARVKGDTSGTAASRPSPCVVREGPLVVSLFPGMGLLPPPTWRGGGRDEAGGDAPRLRGVGEPAGDKHLVGCPSLTLTGRGSLPVAVAAGRSTVVAGGS